MTSPGTWKKLVRTKDVDDVIHQNDADPTEESHHARLDRRLTVWDLMGFGIGIVIGTGIFTLTGTAAKDNAGPAVMISFLVAGVVAMLAALAVPTAAHAADPVNVDYIVSKTAADVQQAQAPSQSLRRQAAPSPSSLSNAAPSPAPTSATDLWPSSVSMPSPGR
jgi:hypothetical protein